jgi:hypothetical protein
MKEPHVIVVVSGGVVQAAYSDQPVHLDVLDHDNWNAEKHGSPEFNRFKELEKTKMRSEYLCIY